MADPAQFIFQVDPDWYQSYWYGNSKSTGPRRVGVLVQRVGAALRSIRSSAGIGRHSKVGSTGMMPGPVVGRTQ